MKTTYFVSGGWRMGTSMMMRALEEGGMNAVTNEARDRWMTQRYASDGYHPNADGFYELSAPQYQEPDFPARYEGRLIKCLWGAITKIAAGDYKVIYMLRPYAEAAESYLAFFGEPMRYGVEEFRVRLETSLGVLRQRRDVEVTVVQYHDTLADPLAVFTDLADRGWPINAATAATIPDPTRQRFKVVA